MKWCPTFRVGSPPQLTSSTLWLSPKACYSGYSRAWHSVNIPHHPCRANQLHFRSPYLIQSPESLAMWMFSLQIHCCHHPSLEGEHGVLLCAELNPSPFLPYSQESIVTKHSLIHSFTVVISAEWKQILLSCHGVLCHLHGTLHHWDPSKMLIG